MENLMMQIRGLLEEDEPDGYGTTAPDLPFAPIAPSEESQAQTH